MRIVFRVLAGLYLAGVPQHLYACGIVCRGRPVPVRSVKTVPVTPAVVATFVPVAVAVPQYSVSYVGGAAYAAPAEAPAQPAAAAASAVTSAPQAAAADSRVQALQDEVGRLRKDLEECRKQLSAARPQGKPEARAPQAAVPQHLAIFTARCAACHEAKAARAKGDGFVLLEGTRLAFLDARQVNRIVAQVYTGKMPKGGPPLSDDEVAQIVAWVGSFK
jgi:mono/diheme cytochrome c family protein